MAAGKKIKEKKNHTDRIALDKIDPDICPGKIRLYLVGFRQKKIVGSAVGVRFVFSFWRFDLGRQSLMGRSSGYCLGKLRETGDATSHGAQHHIS